MAVYKQQPSLTSFLEKKTTTNKQNDGYNKYVSYKNIWNPAINKGIT